MKPFILIEAERIWFQQAANGLGPEVEGTWKHTRHPQMVGRVLPAPPTDKALRFGRFRKAVEGHDPSGLIGLGQGALMIPGRYRLTWWLAAEPRDTPASAPLVTLAVEARHRRVALQQVTTSALGPGPTGIPLDVSFSEPTSPVDFIAWWQGKGAVSFLRAECQLLR